MPQHPPLLTYPFRPFFLLVGIFGALAVPLWVLQLFGTLQLPVGWSGLYWHSHEMLFGFVPAAISGFLLTAMCNWTGATPLRGNGLLALAGLWLAGRIAMLTASWLPLALVSAIDLLFMPVLAVYVLRVLLRYNNKRNLILGVILMIMALANLLMHVGFWQQDPFWLQQGEKMALSLITLIMIVIGGRIIPAFSGNWLRVNGLPADGIRILPPLEKAVLIVTALLIPADLLAGQVPVLVGIIALLAAGLNGARLILWQGWLVTQEPLLWILHLAYSWIVLALLLKGLAAFGLAPATAWQHALGAGAIGTLILGVMTRVALGHTGRPMRLPAPMPWFYAAIVIAAFSRVLAALGWVDYRIGIMLAATGWAIAFGGFAVLYWPILTGPRADGRPG